MLRREILRESAQRSMKQPGRQDQAPVLEEAERGGLIPCLPAFVTGQTGSRLGQDLQHLFAGSMVPGRNSVTCVLPGQALEAVAGIEPT